MSGDEPNWTVETSPQGWIVVAGTLRGRAVVAGPYAKQWQATMAKGQAAKDWREHNTPSPFLRLQESQER